MKSLFEAMVVRASRFEFLPGIALPTCSAEDLVVLKAFADRGQDWLDVEGILLRQRGRLDWDYLLSQLAPLADLKEAPHILARLQRLRKETA
jgi:predicted nucleotidyltransferase